MQFILQLFGRIPLQWLGGLLIAWSASVPVYLASLPRNCRLSMLHATNLCLWNEPLVDYPLRFRPPGLAWVWFVLGGALGAMTTLLLLSLAGKLRQTAGILGAPLNTLAQLAQGAGTAQEEAQQEVLRYIAAGGRPALRELALAAGVNETDFLTRVLFPGPPGLAAQRR